MPLLTLTTDWGNSDPCLPALKGELLSSQPGLQIIDISNDIQKFNTMQAAYVLKTSFKKFPAGTVHYIGMTGNENHYTEYPFMVVSCDGHYFVGYDSGIFSLILGDEELKAYRLPIPLQQERDSLQKMVNDVLLQLCKGEKPEKIGSPDNEIVKSYFTQPTVDPNTLRGAVMYIDSFGNVILNISKELFEKEQKGRKFMIHLRKAEYSITRISKSYEETEVGEMLGLFNAEGYLEIALNKAEASKLLGLKLMDPVRVEFQ
ncbi:MAG: SAM-dependent chlorinase/fluorinase [Bacteroidetes bacterium]|nr:SAM-dependent chlorinase/fluorinase [Bacteroidota bacterium]